MTSSTASALLLNFLNPSELGSVPRASLAQAMDDDDMSVPDSPLDSGDISPAGQAAAMDKQRATLETYLKSLPYQCESTEEMHAHLEYIVGKIAICAKTKNWLVLTTWDGALQWSVNIQSTV